MSADIHTGNLPGRRGRRFKNLIVDARFQLKYTAMIVGVSLLISSILGVFLVEKLRENSRMLALEGEGNQIFQEQLAAADAQIAWALFASFLVFNLVLFLLGVLITHRMAGPLFVFKRYIHELGRGVLPQMRGLRRGDEFTDVLETIELAVSRMRERAHQEIDLLERVVTGLPDQQLRSELERHLEKKKDMMRPMTADLAAVTAAIAEKAKTDGS